MRYFLLYYLPLLLSVSECHALFLDRTSLPPIPRGDGRRVSSRYDSNITFTNANGTLESVPYRYITNITVNGENFRVILDTGSSDLIIKPRGDLPQCRWETTRLRLRPSVTEIFDIGLDGLIGVSFDGAQASDMMAALKDSGWDPTLAEPFLYNIFDQTPEQNNFIGVSLGSKRTPAAIFPATNGRWTILVDDISIDGTNISLPTSTVPNAPTGKLVVLLDTGNPNTDLPSELVDSIYSAIPGARYRPSDHGGFVYEIPCNTTSIVTVYMGGQPFPIHPLDLSDLSVDAYSNSDPPTCVATIEASGGNGEDDGVFGDPFMRNMYSVFNFGDAISKSPTGNASMQLLSQTDPIAAAADVLNVRMPRISSPPTASATDDPVSTLTSSNSPANSASGTTLAAALENASTSPTNSDSEVKKWAPIVIGLLGGNLLVVLILTAIRLALCIKRGGKSSAPKPKYHPVRFGEDEAGPLDGFEVKRYSD
ncbi:aspartic peptidase domain-containing protein [Mycena latifolia]|nr:aspartic peptidase domain-containing protein [Mycena latifolia]